MISLKYVYPTIIYTFYIKIAFNVRKPCINWNKGLVLDHLWMDHA